MPDITADTKITAIRCLGGAHYAEHLPPRRLRVTWNLGKRCNYDCSYCTPHIHDSVSPHIALDVVKRAVTMIGDHCSSIGRTVEYAITGGEPFLHPKIYEILSSIRDHAAASDFLSVTTNGSLPLRVYSQCLPLISNLTISVHFERSLGEIDSVIQTLCDLKRLHPGIYVAANIMLLPNRIDHAMSLLPKLDAHNVQWILRRIRPNTDGTIDSALVQPGTRKNDKSLRTVSLHQQSDLKKNYKIYQDQHLDEWYQQYYSRAEIDLMTKKEKLSSYKNLAVWDDQGRYIESNSDDLLSRELAQFRSWLCFSGTDSVYIDFDGSVYNGACMSLKLGSIYGDIEWPAKWLVCPKNNCVSQTDIITRKCMGEDYLELIDPVHQN